MYILLMGKEKVQWISLVETSTFIKRVEKLLSADELENIKDFLAQNPAVGDVIRGSGGIRKVRISSQQKGKSKGARVIYYFYNDQIPLFLLDVYSKSEKIDLTKTELGILKLLVAKMQKDYGG